ncbi:radical SAM protein [Paenibacillus elgii]|uniref:Radical SAM protein n=1 Tax=Paenibacillus elgii TaxID=189691 RepID=A0A2T6FRT5_9BACL|nr:radical SAM protein [Paenibacillus elgii]PUA34623.1 radical SAM protein [Paenibacillus elgii]
MKMNNSAELELENFIHRLKYVSIVNKGKKTNPSFALNVPSEIGLKLNNNCNLRCKHCFEWNEDGYHQTMNYEEIKQEIDINVIKKILDYTKEIKSNLFLWGGEPLLYSRLNEFIALLLKDPRRVVCTTNGLLINTQINNILKISEMLTLLISIDGFEQEHDYIRGEGTYKRLQQNIDKILLLKNEGSYKGKISISMTISDMMIPRLVDFCKFFDSYNFDEIYLVYPWYITDNIAIEMDKYIKHNYKELNIRTQCSWYSYRYHVSAENIEMLVDMVKNIKESNWNSSIRFQPPMHVEEIKGFILGNKKPVINKTKCLALSSRMDVLPNGKVTSCKLFPELEVGDLSLQNVGEVWNNGLFNKIRCKVNEELMPVCSKCVSLYMYGI